MDAAGVGEVGRSFSGQQGDAFVNLYMITTISKSMDPEGAGFTAARCHPPMAAGEALRCALGALERALKVEILDLQTGEDITFADLRKAADAEGT
jgi:hypothetical protein